MGYEKYMADMLRPLEIFNLETGSIVRGELSAMGGGLDEVSAITEELEREGVVLTGSNYGLDNYERLLPWRPVAYTVADRRAAIAALLRICDADFTFSAVERSLRGCGIRAVIAEGGNGEIHVFFPYNRGIPEGIEKIKEIIEGIVPCHLLPVYKYVYVNWNEVETYLKTWNGIESHGWTWDEFEVYVPEEE